ncbi:MAG: ABC transporter permease [Methylobacter sp.]|nr:ABC transporter permease [Methylobacter sp.]MDP2429146.1 ABC transporter permease [Methylobacter sp.]MDP3053375.1 ABC transporter permease [Methylobacter sp.]MDP3360746.1 ABC transporter permease [Methylobacter sp.]MDZ4218041.1 ABC transporter permease [Methylobacter sp.]
MTDSPIQQAMPPALTVVEQDAGQFCVKLSGRWSLSNVVSDVGLNKKIRVHSARKNVQWDMTAVDLLDSGSALILWQAWGKQLPSSVQLRPEHQALFERWQAQLIPEAKSVSPRSIRAVKFIYATATDFFGQLLQLITLLGQLFLDAGHLLRHPGDMPWSEISITIYESGVRALGITALVGFLIGIVLSYLSALQLKIFGAEVYIIDILGLSVIRELGPLLAAILVAGRSGSAMTAQIGIMRVTEELDALSAMGISHSLRLILPKVMALTLVLPLISIWTSALALLGGMVSAQNTLDISYRQFFFKLPDVVPLLNVFIGLGKSAVFGLMIALIACHFGFRIKPNTESLGNETTNSVVAAITVVIMVDAVFAILFMDVGMP